MDKPPGTTRWGIRARILTIFGFFIAMMAAGGEFVILAHERSHAVLDRVEELNAGVQAALRLSAAVRDLYAHQAHMIILNDTTHIGHYAEAQEDVKNATAEARKYACSIAQCAALDAIAAVASEMDSNFEKNILPLIPAETPNLVQPHARALALVERVVQLTDDLASSFTSAINLAKAHANHAAHLAAISIGVLTSIAFVLILAAAGYVDRSIAVPLRTLVAATDRISRGDWSTSLEARRHDEMGLLASHFNHMAQELRVRQEKLLQAEKLAALGRVAAGVAHELNNPLAVMLGYARLIADSDNDAAKDAHVILSEIDRCRDIVSSLLDFAKPTRVQLKRVALLQLVREVIHALSTTELGLRTDVVAQSDGWVEADESKVRQILLNLLRNAAEAKPKGLVTVIIEQREESVSLRVIDEGPGIPETSYSRIFEPFFTTKSEGTGLGLAVSRSLAQAQGGQLECLAPAAQNGACFALTLPASRSHLLAESTS